MMPALSKKQQKFMGIVRSIQKGEQPASKFNKDAQDVAKDMKKKDVKDFASTKHKGLPMKKEILGKLKEMIKQELSEYTYGVGDVVKDVNPTCPHFGAQGKVKSVNPKSVIFIVKNKGKNFKPGMELEKSHDQMKKMKESVNEMSAKSKKIISKLGKKEKEMFIDMVDMLGFDQVMADYKRDKKAFKQALKDMSESVIQERNDEVQTGKDYTKLWLQSINLIIKQANGLKGALAKHPIKRDVNKLKAVKKLFEKFIKPAIEKEGADNRHYAPNQTQLKKYLANSKFKVSTRILRQTIESSNGYDENSWYYLGDKEQSLIKKMGKVLYDVENKMDKANLENVNESMSPSQLKKMRDDFEKTGDLPPHLKKFALDLKILKKKHKVKNIVVPGLEWMSDMKENINEDGHTDVASAKRKAMLMVEYSNKLLNKLNGMNKEDSLPSWWSDKITLSQNYLEKATNYLLNPVESVNESKKEKDQIIRYLQGLGFDERTAKKAVAKSYNYISKAYRNTGTQYKGDLIANILNKKESVNESRDFEKLYKFFSKKDYFGLKRVMKTQLGNYKRALKKGDKGAQKYSEKDVINSVNRMIKNRAKFTYDELKKAIKKKDIKALKSKLRYDQPYSLAIFNQITGKKLPKNTRDIHSFLDNQFMKESVFAVRQDKIKNGERFPKKPNFNYDPEKGKSRIRKVNETMKPSAIKKMRAEFERTGELPPHLKKFVKDVNILKKKHKVKNIVVPGLEWMSDMKESVNEASVSQVRSTISRVKKQLMKKWAKKGGYENFGQKELRNLKSKFKENPYGSPEERQISQMLSSFDNWAMNYSGDMRESINEDGHTDVASSKRKVMIMVDDSNKLLNKLNGMNKEDSLPSWLSDKITLASDYLHKATHYLLNPVESVNEAMSKSQASELLKQLGGNKFISMTGAKNLTFSGLGLVMQIGKNSKGVTHVRFKLSSKDLYDIDFLSIRGSNVKTKSKEKGVYGDQLGVMIKKNTGLNIRL